MAGKGLRLVLAGDSTSALKALGDVSTKMGSFTGALAGMPQKGGSAFKGLGAAMSASGLPGQFGELQQMIGGLGVAFDGMATKGKASFGKIAGGVGVGLAAAGGVALMASKPLQDANAQLKQSIENTGGSWDDYAGKITSADKKMEGFGHKSADTNEALSKLTQAFNSPEEAMRQMALTADIAARNHDSLAVAADTVIKVHAGSTRALKAYGINTKDTTDLGKAATVAAKAQTKAHTELATAQQHQADLQARLKAAGGTKGAAEAAAVTRAQDALARAGQHLQTVQASIAGGHKSAAAAASELAAAQNGVTAASAKLDAAQTKAGQAAGLSVVQQQELTHANAAVAKAQADVAASDKAATATKADLDKGTVTGAMALDMIAKKTHGLAEAQSDTFGGKLRAAKATVIDFAASVGTHYGGMLITAGPALAGIGGLIESGVIGKIGKAGGALVKGGASFAKFGFSALQAGAQAAAAGVEAMLPWLPFIAAAAAIAAIGYLIYRNWDTIKSALGKVWHAISGAATAAFGAIEGAVKGAINWVKALPGNLMKAITGAATWLVETGKNIIVGLVTGFVNMEIGIAEFYLSLPGKIVGYVADAGRWLFDTGGKILHGLWDGLVAAYKWLGTQEWNIGKKILGWIGDAATWLLDTGGKVLHGLWNGVTGAFEWLGKQEWNIGAKILGWIGDGATWLLDTGENVLKGLWQGLKNGEHWVMEFMGDLAEKLKHAITHPWDILSPSKVAAGYGENIVKGLAGGIRSTAPLAVNAMGGLSGQLGANLNIAAAPGAAGPAGVANYHDSHAVVLNGPITIKPANLDDFHKQVRDEAARSNFSGEGPATAVA